VSPMRSTPKTSFIARHVPGSVRKLTCEEANCVGYLNGWRTLLSIPAQQNLVDFIRSGRTEKIFVEKREGDGLVAFEFPPGQQCLKPDHWERQPIFNVYRKETEGRTLLYPGPDEFIEDSDKHLRKLKEAMNG
jgi:hypothetical protein